MKIKRLYNLLVAYLSTGSKLKPKMIVYRVILRGSRKILELFPVKFLEIIIGLSVKKQDNSEVIKLKNFIPLEFQFIETDLNTTAESFRAGFIEAVGQKQPIINIEANSLDNWQQDNTPLLYRFNLHYLEWAWTMEKVLEQDERNELFEIFFESWYKYQKLLRLPEWSPYVVSLRAVVLVDILNRWNLKDELRFKISKVVFQSYGFLRLFKEKDVEGNHLVKNLKALIVIGCYLNDLKIIEKYLRELKNTLTYQILKDGSHYERSSSYHVQVLMDLTDIKNAVESFNNLSSVSYIDLLWLESYINSMKLWLLTMGTPDDGIWLVNDAYKVSTKLLDYFSESATNNKDHDKIDYQNIYKDYLKLVQASQSSYYSGNNKYNISKISGYLPLNNKNGLCLLFDVGDPCPNELPAHCHADTLNVLMYFNKSEILCDTGVSTYESGPRRDYERSTAAHNTLTIDSLNSTEVWGAFRAGRRAKVKLVNFNENEDQFIVEGSHEGYSHLTGSPIHNRKINLSKKINRLEILDHVFGSHTHFMEWYFHFPKTVKLDKGTAVNSASKESSQLLFSIEGKNASSQESNIPIGSFKVLIDTEINCDVDYLEDDNHLSTRAVNFGILEQSSTLKISYTGELPVAVKFVFDDFVYFN